MTTETTEPTAQPVERIQQNSYMAALSLAQLIMGDTSAMPTSFEVSAPAYAPEQPGLRFYFHHDVPGLRQFRDDQMLTEAEPDHRESGSIYVEATGEINGVHVVAWSLIRDQDVAVSA